MTDSTNALFIYKINIDKKKADANFALDITYPQFISFIYGRDTLDLFVEPDDDIKFFFNANQLLNTLRFEGKGAENNICLTNFKRQFRSDNVQSLSLNYLSPSIDITTIHHAKTSNTDTYLSYVNEYKENELNYLDIHKSLISRKLYSYLFKNVHYTHDTKLYAYFLFNALTKEECSLAIRKFFSYNGFNYTDYDRNETPVFRNALRAFIHFQARQMFGDDTKSTVLYETIEKKLANYDRFWLEKELLIEVLKKENNPSFGRQHIETFRKNCPFKNIIADLDAAYDSYLDVSERAEAPDFQTMTNEGQVKNLSDYRGKVVYINFWASWCQPCIANFEKYAHIRNQLFTEGVILLNVNIDEVVEKYQAALNRINPVGVNVQPLSIIDIKKLYNIYSIPSYFIVDKNGKFAYLSEAEDRDVMTEFRKLLSEN